MRLPACDCGARSVRFWDEGADYEFWTVEPRFTPVCQACWTRKDNAEPGDPDGEAFRGGEAAAYQREQQMAAKRLK